MKLLNNLYSITSKQHETAYAEYSVKLNKDCEIYKAHFPDYPITPGVCIIQTAMELLEDALSKRLDIIEVKNAKFLSALLPVDEPVVFRLEKICIDENAAQVKAQALVSTSETTCSKISVICRIA